MFRKLGKGIMKKVIFVGSASRAGSTLLGFMLANQEHAIATGDIWAMFWPHRDDHHRTNCMCEGDNCTVWREAKAGGEQKFYSTLFQTIPNLELIVDTSKWLPWFEAQRDYLTKYPNIEQQEILIFKDPYEQAHSVWKRDNDYKHSMYHCGYKDYLNSFEQPIVVEYSDLAEYPEETLKKLCDKLGLEYYEGKSRYWENTDWHLWGGSLTTLASMYEKGSKRYNDCKKALENNINTGYELTHREIYYSEKWKTELPKKLKQTIKSDRKTWLMYERLRRLKL